MQIFDRNVAQKIQKQTHYTQATTSHFMFALYLVNMTMIFTAYSTMTESFHIKLRFFVTADNCEVTLTLAHKKTVDIINANV